MASVGSASVRFYTIASYRLLATEGMPRLRERKPEIASELDHTIPPFIVELFGTIFVRPQFSMKPRWRHTERASDQRITSVLTAAAMSLLRRDIGAKFSYRTCRSNSGSAHLSAVDPTLDRV